MERTFRLKGNQSNRRIELPQPAARADEGAARPETGDEMRQPSARLLDDLGARRIVVRAPVRVVVVLIRIEILIGILGIQTPRLADGAVRAAFERVCQDELCAECAQRQLALRARVLRHAQLHWIPARRADHRVRDARIARRRVEDRPPGRQFPGGFAFENHPRGRAVFHRAAWILPLRHGVQLRAGHHR